MTVEIDPELVIIQAIRAYSISFKEVNKKVIMYLLYNGSAS